MGRETELDDLELEELLEEDDFLEDFDVDELAEDLLTADESQENASRMESSDADVDSPASRPPAKKEVLIQETITPPLPWWQRFFLPLSLLLVLFFLAPQVYLAMTILRRKPVIYSQVVGISPPILAEEQPDQVDARHLSSAAAEIPAANLTNVTSFSIFYPLYSLSGLRVLGVDIRLIFSPSNDGFTLSREQVVRLRGEVIKLLDQLIAGRFLEEITAPTQVFTPLIKKSVKRILRQWQCPPVEVKLENLVIN